MSYFEVAPAGQKIAFENIDHLFENDKDTLYILICYIVKNMMFKEF